MRFRQSSSCLGSSKLGWFSQHIFLFSVVFNTPSQFDAGIGSWKQMWFLKGLGSWKSILWLSDPKYRNNLLRIRVGTQNIQSVFFLILTQYLSTQKLGYVNSSFVIRSFHFIIQVVWNNNLIRRTSHFLRY